LTPSALLEVVRVSEHDHLVARVPGKALGEPPLLRGEILVNKQDLHWNKRPRFVVAALSLLVRPMGSSGTPDAASMGRQAGPKAVVRDGGMGYKQHSKCYKRTG